MAESQLQFSYYFDWHHCPDQLLNSEFAQCRDLGIKKLVFVDKWIERLLQEPKFAAVLKLAAQSGNISFGDMHAPFGECFDLAAAGCERRNDMIKDHIRALGYASDFGCRTYTIHIGAFDSVFFATPNDDIRKLAVDSLEKLIPYAEKYDIAIAVENAFECSNTPHEVMYYVNYFNHRLVGCCFDNGHANIMAATPGKDRNLYSSYMRNTVWGGEVELCDNAFELMAPRIFTCHLHDNNGYSDQHSVPGNGNVNWEELAEKLLNHAPQLISLQTEAKVFAEGLSFSEIVKRYRKYFPVLA